MIRESIFQRAFPRIFQIIFLFVYLNSMIALQFHRNHVGSHLGSYLLHHSVGNSQPLVLLNGSRGLKSLKGLRSATTSDELKMNPQFTENGHWLAIDSHQGLKLSEFLLLMDPILFSSSTASKNAIRKGLIRLNGSKPKNTDIVNNGDVIESFIRSQQGSFCSEFEQNTAFDDRKVSVLWEDDHCAVVIKPTGMPVFRTKDSTNILSNPAKDSTIISSDDALPELKNSCSCLQTALPYSLAPVSAHSDLQPLRRPQAVHRLDKGTGGLILVAKTRPALVDLTAQFSNRTVKKRYRAIVVGKLQGVERVSDQSEGRGQEAIEGVITEQLSGQSALTEWSVEPGMQTKSLIYGWITTVDLRPHTGRTHQLRRHMDLLHHPIMGDSDYWFQEGGRLPPFSTANNYPSVPLTEIEPSFLNMVNKPSLLHPGDKIPSTPTLLSPIQDEQSDKKTFPFFPPRLQRKGIYLWSVGISFNHPVSGERLDLSIPEPDSYKTLREELA